MTEWVEIDADLLARAAALLAAARACGETVATAESCTGGLLAAALTAIPGSSEMFERGFVTYSNSAKSEMLGVPFWLIERHGAVSEDVARAMAGGVLTIRTRASPSRLPGSPGLMEGRRRSRWDSSILRPAGATSQCAASASCSAISGAPRSGGEASSARFRCFSHCCEASTGAFRR
jgi:hypothetical protein